MNFTTLADQLLTITTLLKHNTLPALLIVSLLWVIHSINFLTHLKLNRYGIIPRYLPSLPNIFISPFLHGSFNHLFFNSIPLFILVDFIFLDGIKIFIYITLIITFLSGFAIWLLGRNGIHIGASHIIMGYWAYLLVNAYQQPSTMTIVLGILCIYYLGGLLINLFPTEEKTSWEGHVFGFIAGISAVYFYPIINQIL